MTKSTLAFDAFDVVLIRSKRRSLALEVGHKGVVARAPMRMSKKDITEFIYQKQNWIRKTLDALPPLPAVVPITEMQNLLLHGEKIAFNIREGQRGKPTLNEAGLHLPVIKSHLPIEATVKTKLVKWYKNIALDKIQERVNYYSIPMAVQNRKLKGLYVRDYKRRWGSCDAKGVLSFNWRIIMAPPEMLDYVVVHELAHCHEFNHSKRFWSLVEQQLPDYQQRSDWFNTNGRLLYPF